MKIGDTVINASGWQGEILKISPSPRFGDPVLVQYASRREWETQGELVVAVSAPERDEALIQPGDSLEVRSAKQALARWGKERTPAPQIKRPPR
jgi:preprotein translocase subunit YajC